jgi:hypothetical protein
MFKIAHRGNLNGPNPEKENEPSYIVSAINQGFDCEVDLWRTESGFFLGHDEPQYEIKDSFLFELSDKLWIHCKNLEALTFVSKEASTLNGFWHQEDDFTLTTKGYIWTYPNRPTTDRSILVHLPKLRQLDHAFIIAGICSDYIH